MPIRVLQRDSYGRTIQVECPACLQGATVGLKDVDHLEDGDEITFACPHCYQPIDVAPRDLVIDGGLALVRLGDDRYMVTFTPSSGPIGEPATSPGSGVPTTLDGMAVLDAFLQAIAVPPDRIRQGLAELEAHLVAVQTIRLPIHLLKRARLIR